MALVGDRDRERTATALRRHYVEGRISAEELSDRLEEALRARTRIELMLAARSLPGHSPLYELLGPPARAASHAVGRAVVFLVLAAVWSLSSLILLLTFAGVVLVHGATTTTLVGFPLGWVLMTWVVWRLWERGRAYSHRAGLEQ
jgi:hypothetical protein